MIYLNVVDTCGYSTELKLLSDTLSLHQDTFEFQVKLESSSMHINDFGQHFFNQIARDTISSDVAVFEASDLIEIGVAPTWSVID